MVLVKRSTQPPGPLKAMGHCRLADTAPIDHSVIVDWPRTNEGSAQHFHDSGLGLIISVLRCNTVVPKRATLVSLIP